MEKENSWISEYIRFMKNKDFKNAILIKEKYFPNSLFKYRPLNDYALENLENNTVWLADITTLNDPFEAELLFDFNLSVKNFFSSKEFNNSFKDKFGFPISDIEIKNIVNSANPFDSYYNLCKKNNIELKLKEEKDLTTIENYWNEVNKENKNKVRICSLSERNDSLLMWSHYASQHEGICIEYDYSNFHKYKAFLQPVHYTNELCKIDKFDDLTGINVLMASTYKSKEWSYENEWRLTVTPNENINSNIIPAPIPLAIYVGTRFNLNHSYKKSQIFRICKEKGIPIFQMKIHPNEYKIIIDYEYS